MNAGKTEWPVTFSPRKNLAHELGKNPKDDRRNMVPRKINTSSDMNAVKRTSIRARDTLILDMP